MDSGNLGLYPGGGFHIHLTCRFGDLPGRRGGAKWPVNAAGTLLLQGEEAHVASSIYHSQRLGSASLMVRKTVWAAEQYVEEASKGTLEVGKLADLVILDQDPLRVAPKAIL